MKFGDKVRTLASGLLVISIGVGLWWILVPAAHQSEGSKGLGFQPEGKPHVQPISVKGGSINAVVSKQPGMNEKSLSRILEFSDLQKHVIVTDEKSRRLRDLISDPETIQEASSLLQSLSGTELENAGALVRLEAINLLEAAVRLNEGSAREQAVEALIESLRKDWFQDESLTDIQKRLILGDQVELYRILMAHQPERARAYAESLPKESRQLKLVQFARAYHSHQSH